MGTQGTGRKRTTSKDKTTAEEDALNLIAREAEARLAAKRAARAEAREIRMKELERQQKEIFQVQKKYYGLNSKVDDGLDNKWGDIEQWMEDSERYSRPSRIQTLSDDDERMSVGSRGSVKSDLDAVGAYAGGGSSSYSLKKSKKKKKHKHKDKNGYDDEYSVMSSRSSRLSDESRVSRSSKLDLPSSLLTEDSRASRLSRLDLQPAAYASSDLYSLNGLSSARATGSAFNGYQLGSSLSQIPQRNYCRGSLYEDSLCSGSRRVTGSGSGLSPLDYPSYRSSGSRASSRSSSRAGSARTSPVDNCSSMASFLRSAASSGLPRDLDDVTIPDFPDAEDGNCLEKGPRAASALTSTTLTSLGGTSSRRGSGETALTLDAETSIREIKEIHELKDQIQDVESKYTQNLKEIKDKLTEVEEKYRKAMVSNAQLDNEKHNLMYQVDTLKDSLMELEELLAESRRECQDKIKEFEREKYAHGVLQFQFNELKETLKQSEELLNEIRQLRLKEEGFQREISDLQETVEWKDKKISALERQKEYTDAIRVERDELREEVVKLKDILKKHGIVLGPDLNINGEVVETNTEESPSGDSPSQPSQESPLSPTEGNNSMLGNTEEEKETRNDRKEEIEPEQRKETHDVNEESHFENICNGTDASKVKICFIEEQEYQKCEDVAAISGAISTDRHETETTTVENLLKLEPFVQTEMDNQELQETGAAIKPTSEDPVDKLDVVDCVQVNEAHPEHSENVIKEEVLVKDEEKKSIPTESVPAASENEPQQDLEAIEDGANEENEEVSVSKTQGTSAAGKKKKRKKRAKKKRADSVEVKEHNTEAEKDDKKLERQTGSDVKSALGDDGSLTEAKKELLTKPHSDNITDSGQINSAEAHKDATEQLMEHAEPFSENVKDEQMNSLTEKGEKLELTEKVTLVEINTTSLETEKAAESVISPQAAAALGTSHIESQSTDKIESPENVSSLDNATPNVESEVGTEILVGNGADVAQIDKSESNEYANETELTENDSTDGLPSPCVVTKSERDNIFEERETVNCGESCNIESEQPSSINAEEVIVALKQKDTDLNEGLGDSEMSKLDKKHENYELEGIETEKSPPLAQDEILNNEESPKLQHVGQNEESTCDVSDSAEAFDEAAIMETKGCDTANEINSIEDQNGEKMAHKDDTEQEKSENYPESEACNAVEAQPECSSDVKETEAVITSGQLNPLDEEVEVGIQGLADESNSLMDEPIITQVQHVTNRENDIKELKVLDKETESRVPNDSESETCPELSPEAEQCRPMEQDSDKDKEEDGEGLSFDFDDTEMEAAIASEGSKPLEEEVEVGIQVLANESNSLMDEPIKTEVQHATNVENDIKELKALDKKTESRVPKDSESETCPELSPEAEQCPMEQDSDKEEGGEGLSFDFDDIEMEAAIASEGSKPLEEEVEVGVEVLPDDANVKEELIETEAETQNVDGKEMATESAVDSLVGEIVQKPEEPTLEGATEELTVQNSSENNNKLSSSVEEGFDAAKHECESKDAVVAKGRQETGSQSELPQSGKDVKKNSKKGKGKGKDECKMT